MKNKKIIATAIVLATVFCIAGAVLPFKGVAFAEELVGSAEETSENLADKIAAYIKTDLVPIVSGLLTAITAILAILVPYIKTLGKLKSTQSAYACVFDENERLTKLASEKSVEGISEKITEEVAANMEARLSKYENLLAELVKESEENACRITSLIEGAKIAWKEAEGADAILAASPTASALRKNALTVEFLKSYVAKTLGVKRDEIDKKIDEELCDD